MTVTMHDHYQKSLSDCQELLSDYCWLSDSCGLLLEVTVGAVGPGQDAVRQRRVNMPNRSRRQLTHYWHVCRLILGNRRSQAQPRIIHRTETWLFGRWQLR